MENPSLDRHTGIAYILFCASLGNTLIKLLLVCKNQKLFKWIIWSLWVYIFPTGNTDKRLKRVSSKLKLFVLLRSISTVTYYMSFSKFNLFYVKFRTLFNCVTIFSDINFLCNICKHYFEIHSTFISPLQPTSCFWGSTRSIND